MSGFVSVQDLQHILTSTGKKLEPIELE
ncbi:hypothetical protein LINPERPRIM_LOCUS26295 [Linum perenne]